MENKKELAEKIKSILQKIGSITGAISGVALGLLSILRVFYPDTTSITSSTKPSETVNNNGITELK